MATQLAAREREGAREGERARETKPARATTKWGAVVTVIAAAYPTSKYAELGEDELRDTARIWAEMMDDVPLSAVEALCRKVLKSRANPFAPTLGDFRTAWAAWDYWAELNRVEPSPRHPALPEPAPHLNGPGARGYRAQKAAHAARGAFVCCQCANAWGVHPPAVLRITPGGEVWRCATDQCDFCWPFGATESAPIYEEKAEG